MSRIVAIPAWIRASAACEAVRLVPPRARASSAAGEGAYRELQAIVALGVEGGAPRRSRADRVRRPASRGCFASCPCPRVTFDADEPEPRAFRVRPRPNEAWDSWMDRLVTRHEVTRAELFRHLGCNPRLASRDLARGKRGLAEAEHAAFDGLIETLAWAVEADVRDIETTLVTAPETALLPPAMRVFGCPSCWRDAIEAAKPAVIARDWILRASWMCLRHDLPLAPVRRFVGDRAPRAAARMLETQVAAMRRLRQRFPPTAAMSAFNRSAIRRLMGERDAGMRRGEDGYCVRLVANRYHLSRARIVLLAATHSERTRSSDRFDEFVGLSVPALFKSGGNLPNPKARRQESQASPPVPEGLVTLRINRWQASLPDLIEAYAQLICKRSQVRQGIGGALPLQHGNFGEFNPQSPAGRLFGVGAPSPI